MLDLMLGSSDDAVSTGEIFAYFRPYMKHHFSPECSCGNPNCTFWHGLLDPPESQFHSRIIQQRAEINTVVDSSKDLRWVLDSNKWAAECGLPVKNVVIWKNPIDLSYSHWKRGEKVSTYRRMFVNYYGRFLDIELPFVAINYSTLVTETKSTLLELCDLLSLPYDESRINFWGKQHHHFFGSAGTGKQVGSASSSIKSRTDFPDEFATLFKKETTWLNTNKKFKRIVSRLMANDLKNKPDLLGKPDLNGLRPIWYYRHAAKSALRKRFPSNMEPPR